MDPLLISRLECLVEHLLLRLKEVEGELEKLRLENAALVADRERIAGEVDRILEKIDLAGRGGA